MLLMVLIILMTALTSCYDAREVTEWAYVYSIGMEKGVTDKLRMSVQIPTMTGGQGGEGSGAMSGGGGGADIQEKNGYLTITIDCPSFYSGVNMMNSFLPREINYMHTKYMVYSESLAREGIDTYINAFVRGRQIRRNLYFIITKGSVSDFLKENIPVLGTALSKAQENMMAQEKNTGFFDSVRYGHVLNRMKTTYSQPIAILAAVNDFNKFKEGEGDGGGEFKTSGDYYAGELVRKGGTKVEFFGTALFNGGKMVGELNGDETRAMLMARGDFERGFYVVEDPKAPDKIITVDVRKQKTRNVKVRFEEGMPIIDLKVFLEGDILAIQSTVDYESKELKPILEEAVKKQIKSQLDKTIKKCQKLNTEVFKFGFIAATHFATIQDWEEYNWLGTFKDAQVNTEVEFTIRRTGTMLKSSEIYSSEGEKSETK